MNFNFNNYFGIIEKIIAVSGSIIYFIYAIIVLKQVQSMSKKIFDVFNGFIKTIAFFHLLFAAFLIVLTILVL